MSDSEIRSLLLQEDMWKLFELPASQDAQAFSAYLQGVVERCSLWFTATTASLFLRDGNTSDFSLVCTGGLDPVIPAHAKIVLGEGIAGLTAKLGKAVLINDPQEHGFLRQHKVRRNDRPLASAMVVPLITSQGFCTGVLNISRREGLDCYLPSDLEKVQSVAGHLALAIENARMMAEVAETRTKLETIFRSIGVAVLVVNQDGLIQERNPMAERLFGDGPWLKDSLEGVSPALAKAIDPNNEGSVTVSDPQQDRTWRVSQSPLAGGSTIVIEEITGHERDRREMSKLQRLAEIGQMTAAVAHEIRNPLTGIRSAAQMIVESPESAEELAAIIDEEVLKLNDLCEEFLEFARPLAIRLKSVQLSQLVSEAAAFLKPQFDAAGVQLDLEISPETPTIEADVVRLEQVIRNLALNALQACRTGGRVVFGVDANGFWVQDTGEGMAQEQLDRLFVPFFTTKANGTGLGLSNVKKIVDAHGGDIKVASSVGQGSRFEVRLAGKRAA